MQQRLETLEEPIIRGFRAPENFEYFKDHVLNKVEDYFNAGIWEGIKRNSVDSWLSNFQDNDEVYLALKILDNLIYCADKATFSTSYTNCPSKIRNQYTKRYN